MSVTNVKLSTQPFVFAAAFVLAVGFLGCGSDNSTGSGDQCPEGEAQIGGECLQKCVTATECDNPGASCVETIGDFKVCSDTTTPTDTGPDISEDVTEDASGFDYFDDCPNLQSCAQSSCSEQDTDARRCVLENCGSEYSGCGLSGPDSCKATYTCIDGCQSQTNEDQCIGECVSDGTVDAQQSYLNLAACQESNCSNETGASFVRCTLQQCGGEYTNCGLSDGNTCKAIKLEVDDCQPDNEGCELDARSSGSLEAQKEYAELRVCEQNECADADATWLRCMLNNCRTEWDTGCGLSGSGTCQDINSCGLNGGTGCIYEASYTEQLKYADLQACAQRECRNANNQQQCVQNKCSAELSECPPPS